MIHELCCFSCISLNQPDLETFEVLLQNEFGQFLLINVLMVYLILYGFLFQQDHSCFYLIKSSKEDFFCFIIFFLTCLNSFLSSRLLVNHFLFKLQIEFYENLSRLREISISFKQKYFKWVNSKSRFLPHFYLKNTTLLKIMN